MSGIEIAATRYGDVHDAVEVRMIVADGEPGRFRSHMVLVHRSSLAFLLDDLEAHRLDEDLDPCPACAAQTFAARLTHQARLHEHTCPDPSEKRSA